MDDFFSKEVTVASAAAGSVWYCTGGCAQSTHSTAVIVLGLFCAFLPSLP